MIFRSVDEAVRNFEEEGFQKIHEGDVYIIMAQKVGEDLVLLVFIESALDRSIAKLVGLDREQFDAIKRFMRL